MREVLFAVLVLACPLMMIWMMRGHGHGHGTSGHAEHRNGHEQVSTDELRRQRAELDRAITERELTGSQQSQQPGIQQRADSHHASHHSGGGK